MNIHNLDSPPTSETFGQDASFRLDQPIGAMSISPSGRDVVLASKEGLQIIDLDQPYEVPRHLPHRTPWEVADVQWSPFAVRDYWIVSTSNQKALVWNVGVSGWRDAIEFVLHAHTRAITDINFSAHHPDVLATCAVDSFVHAWDLRTPARPAFSFSDWFAGATQVKWSRQEEHVIASSHDRYLHIWDKRKGAIPARTIQAHDTKIYGLDWNRFEPTKIVTCSLDKTIKFWNTTNPEDVPDRVIETPFPVWRARHTPFGWGLLAMPQRSSSDLYLYDRRPSNGVLTSGAVPPAATFSGHKGNVKEFLWRARGTIKEGVDHRDFQLVSWGTDGELRLHDVGENTFVSVGYEKGISRPMRLNYTRRNARYRTFRAELHDSYSPVEMPGRTDSNQTQHHSSFGAKARQSTNIGMSKISVAQFRGWLHGGKRERRTGMHGKSTVRQDMNPIAWMKNVKIVSWGPDSLADEITHVGERFSRVEFESIEIGQRKATMSLQGPWGETGAMVYTRADFRFPKTYPRDAAAVVSIYKTSSINEEVHKTLATEINTISETYASRQRGCIEAIVRYLLHEQTLEQVVSWLLGEDMVDSNTLAGVEATGDLSSDSDDDNLDDHPDPSSSSANLRVPLAKGCGALWSSTGALVCFFPQSSKEPTSLLSSLGTNTFADQQSSRLFEGFGRIQASSPARRPGNGTQPTVDEHSSEISDITSTFSSSSSSTSSSGSGISMRDGFTPYGNTVTMGLRQRSRSGDRSNKSTTQDGTKLGDEPRLNVVSIHHDIEELLPSRKSLAQHYKIFGPSSEICEHNAAVAETSHLHDLAAIWRLVSLILQRRVPLEAVEGPGTSYKDVTVIAKRTMARLRRKDSGIDLGFDDFESSSSKGNIMWGNHPLGSRYLLTAIFGYFEKQGDVQMLALLSCVFAQRLSVDDGHARDPSSALLNSPYYPSLEVTRSLLPPWSTQSDTFRFGVTKPSVAPGVAHGMHIPSVREPQHRRRNTASLAIRPDTQQYDEHNSRQDSIAADTSSRDTLVARTNTTSVSTSPEESRFSRRANSGIAFAASKASLNALAQTFQHSPPSNASTAGSSLKKFSPSTTAGWTGAFFGNAQQSRASRNSQVPSEANSDDATPSNLRGSMSLANLQDLRRDSRKIRGSRGSLRAATDTANGRNGIAAKAKKRMIRTTLRNQDQFDLEGHADIPLLDPDMSWKHQTYRLAYADLLGAWGLFLQQAELLQFDGESPNVTQQWSRGTPAAGTHTPKLEITKCCIECGNTFAPIEKNGVPIGWHCATISCHLSGDKRSKNQVCSICQRIAHGLTVPCLQCGHLTCYECAQGWFGQSHHPSDQEATSSQSDSNDAASHALCPTGCGCPCPTLQTVDVPIPPDGEKHQGSQDLAPRNLFRQASAMSVRLQRHKSEAPTVPPGPDTALGAMMALSRSRAASAATTKTAVTADADGLGDGYTVDELVPWSSGKFTSLGRGIGGGLSRGLSNRSSDATIRKA